MKNINVIKNDDTNFVSALLQKFNPFALRSSNGEPMIFTTATEAYIALMMLVYSNFPKGYIEMPLLLSTIYRHLSWSDCVKLAESMKPQGISLILDLDYTSDETKKFFSQLAAALCNWCGTKYTEFYVNEAYPIFIHRFELDYEQQKANNTK